MPKVLLKIIAVLAGLGILIYLLGRKLTEWEAEVVQDYENEPSPSLESTPPNPPPMVDGQYSAEGDLKKIKGIGPVIEEKLRNIGYHHVQQIANLTEEEKARIEEELNFPGRIERDQWVEQARSILG